MAPERPGVREERVVVLFDKDFAGRLNDLATRRYEGNRSLLVRVAVRDLLDREDAAQESPTSHRAPVHPLMPTGDERAA